MRDLTDGPRPGFWWMLWRVGGAVPLFFALITVVLSIASFGSLRDGLAFEVDGIDTHAEITDRYTKRVRRDEHTVTEHYVQFRYVGENVSRQATREVSRKVYEASDIGTSRTVRYLAGRPGKVEFQIGETMQAGRRSHWAALFVGLLTLGTLWWQGGRAVDAIRARKYGTIERATVIDIVEHKGKKSNSYTLQWFDKDGEISSSLSSQTRNRYEPYPSHTSIEIYRGAGGRAWWVGDIGPRADAATVPSVGKS